MGAISLIMRAQGCCLKVTEDELVDVELFDVGEDDVPAVFGVVAVF
jgi:hypothetical protein